MLELFPKIVIVAACVVLLSGCASSPPTHFYVLEAQNSSSASRVGTPNDRVIGIGPISIPALLERKQMVTRSDQGIVEISEFHQWAAPLRDNIAAVITQNLAALQVHNVIRGYPWGAYGPVNYRVILDIDRFDTQSGKRAILEARWVIMNEKGHIVFENHHSKIEHLLQNSTYPTAVKALSAVLYEFSQQISLALDRLN
jgi:uncharacterized lipoprotein YmbA